MRFVLDNPTAHKLAPGFGCVKPGLLTFSTEAERSGLGYKENSYGFKLSAPRAVRQGISVLTVSRKNILRVASISSRLALVLGGTAASRGCSRFRGGLHPTALKRLHQDLGHPALARGSHSARSSTAGSGALRQDDAIGCGAWPRGLGSANGTAKIHDCL